MLALRRLWRNSVLVLGLAIIVVVFIASIVLLDNDIATGIVTAGATVLVSVFTAVSERSAERTAAQERQIREKKTPVYEEFIAVAFDYLWSSRSERQSASGSIEKRQRKSTAKEPTTNRLQDLIPQLIIWGTDDVISKWVAFRNLSSGEHEIDPRAVLQAFEGLMLEIRKDLGHNDELLADGDLLRMFVNNLDRDID